MNQLELESLGSIDQGWQPLPASQSDRQAKQSAQNCSFEVVD